MNRKVCVNGVGADPSISNSPRMAVPSRVPSGSLVDTTSRPWVVRSSASRRHCVDLPEPSTPSNAMSAPRMEVNLAQ